MWDRDGILKELVDVPRFWFREIFAVAMLLYILRIGYFFFMEPDMAQAKNAPNHDHLR